MAFQSFGHKKSNIWTQHIAAMRRQCIIISNQTLMFLVLVLLAGSVSAGPAPKGTLKTIEAKEGLIDCIDIYKQPAFDHPLLKNHTIQLKPSWYLEDQGKKSQHPALNRDWTKYGQCPDGSIPVLRNSPTQGLAFPGDHFIDDILGLNRSSRRISTGQTPGPDPTHEFAMTYLDKGSYYGTRAILNTWNPQVAAPNEMSLSTARLISSGGGDKVDRIEAGWIVTSSTNRPFFYVYWTAHGSDGIRGCYNLDCPGFVKVEQKFPLGVEITNVSSYHLQQHEVEITIVKDKFTGHWWVTAFGINWGYWPGSLFTNLNTKADYVFWGGEVINSYPMGSHTMTKMGSGFFPYEGYKHACFTRHLGYYNEDENVIFPDRPDKILTYVTKNKCYDVHVTQYINNLGLHFFFGGPGYSDQCRF